MGLTNLSSLPALFQVVFWSYAAATLFSFLSFFFRGRGFRALWISVTGCAFLADTLFLVHRWMEAGRPPFKTLFETMLFYPWCILLSFFILVVLYRLFFLGFLSNLISLIGLVYATLHPDIEFINLPPALQSGWFVPHVVIYFLSYAILFSTAMLALVTLLCPYGWVERWVYKAMSENPAGNKKEGIPLQNRLEQVTYKSLYLGFTLLSIGLVLGAVWGKMAWGDYWSWDPKENWALITWFIYLADIHLLYIPGWRGKKVLVGILLGFCAVVFTYLGINILPTAQGSLHVYQ